jgi:outer membrane protein assembly factor BamB
MNRSRTVLFTLLLMCFLFSSPLDIFATDGWPMFGQNPQHTSRSQAVGPQTNGLKWTMRSGRYIGMAIASDGTIYVAGDGTVSAIAADGSMKWILPFDSSNLLALGADRTVYVVGGSVNLLYALNPDGTTKWSFDIGTYGNGLVIAPDGTIYISDYNGEIVAVTATGQQKWRYQIAPGGDVVFPSAVGTDGTIYGMAYDPINDFFNGLYAINPDGTLKWHFSTYSSYTAPSIGSDGTIYTLDLKDTLYAVRSDGTLKWSIKLEGIESSPAIGADGTVYVDSLYHTLSAVNPDGSLKWNYKTDYSFSGGSRFSDPPAIGSDGTIYVQGLLGTLDQDKVFAINPDGSLKWSGALDSEAVTAPILDPQGTLYIASTNLITRSAATV